MLKLPTRPLKDKKVPFQEPFCFVSKRMRGVRELLVPVDDFGLQLDVGC